jgi:hypothetical protein
MQHPRSISEGSFERDEKIINIIDNGICIHLKKEGKELPLISHIKRTQIEKMKRDFAKELRGKKSPKVLGRHTKPYAYFLLVGAKDGATASVGAFTQEPGWSDDDSGLLLSHPDPEIVYVVTGAIRYTFISPDGKRKKEVTARPGDLLYVYPGTLHGGHVVSKDRYSGIVFCPKAVEGGIQRDYVKAETLPVLKSK